MTYAGQMFPDLTSGNICADASVWSVLAERRVAGTAGHVNLQALRDKPVRASNYSMSCAR